MYVKAGSFDEFGLLDFSCQGKRVCNNTKPEPVISIRNTHDVQFKILEGTLVHVTTKQKENMERKKVDNKKEDKK